MNNRMTKNTYVSTTETERQTKQIKRIETESWIETFLMVAQWEEGVGKWVKR